MREIYRDTWRFMTRHWIFLVLLAALLEVIPLFISKGQSLAEFIVGITITYGMHRYFLFGENFGGMSRNQLIRKSTARRFFLAWAVSIASLVLLSILFVLFLLDHGANNSTLAIIALPAASSSYFLMLVLFGTALPAAAAGDRFGILMTLGRARKTAGSIAGGLLLGPGIVGFIAISATIVSARFNASISNVALNFVVGVFSRMIGFFITGLAVAVLCRAYRGVAPADIGLAQTPA